MNPELDLLESIKMILPNINKLGFENIELKKQNNYLRSQVDLLISENQSLKKQVRQYKDQSQRDSFKKKKWKNKYKELKKINSKRSSSSHFKNKDSSITKSKSVTQFLTSEEIDEMFDIEQKRISEQQKKEKISDFNSISTSDPKEKTKKNDIFDEYFKESSHSETKDDQSDNTNDQKGDEPNKITEKHNSDEEKEDKNDKLNDSDVKDLPNQEVSNISKAKQPKPKKVSILPAPQLIPELLQEIKSADVEQINQIVMRVLAESFSSLTALKKRYVDILNSFSVSIKTTPPSSDGFHQIVTFFVKFASRISPESLESLKKSVSTNKPIISAILAAEEMNGLL